MTQTTPSGRVLSGLFVALTASLLLAASGVALAQVAPPASDEPGASTWPVPSMSPSAGPSISAAPQVMRPEGAFVATSYDTWGGGLVEPLRGSSLTLSLLSAGRLEGETGCGSYLGGYSVEGEAISLGVISTDTVSCGARRGDEAFGFTQALAAVSRWVASPSGIDLLDEAGQVRVRLERPGETSLAGDWLVERWAGPGGELVEVITGTEASLVLAADSSVSGGTGCRDFRGDYLAEGDRIVIAPIVVVGLPCRDPERALLRQDRRLLELLDKAVAWRRTGDALTLADTSGAVLLELAARPAPQPALASPVPTPTPTPATSASPGA